MKSYSDDIRAIRARVIRVRIIRARIAIIKVVRVRIAGVRNVAAKYRIVEVVRLGRIIVSGAEGTAPVTQAHSLLPTSFSLMF